MIGVLVVTHGKLAEGLKDSIELIIGEQKSLRLKVFSMGMTLRN